MRYCGGRPAWRLGRLRSMRDSQAILDILPLLIPHVNSIAIMIYNIDWVFRFQIYWLLLGLSGYIWLFIDDFGWCVLLILVLSDLMNQGLLWLPSQGLLLCRHDRLSIIPQYNGRQIGRVASHTFPLGDRLLLNDDWLDINRLRLNQ